MLCHIKNAPCSRVLLKVPTRAEAQLSEMKLTLKGKALKHHKTVQQDTIVWLLKVNKIVHDVSLLLVFFFQHSQDICLNPTKSEVNFNLMKTTQKTNKTKKMERRK